MTDEQVKNVLVRIFQTEFGMNGTPVPVTATSTGLFCAFQVWDATTKISTITINGTAITAFAALALPVGFVVYGNITSITVTAGSGLAYSGNNQGL